MAKMRNVTPRITGIICSNRRMMYLPTSPPLARRPRKSVSGRKHSVGPPEIRLRRADGLPAMLSQSLLVHFTCDRNSEIEDHRPKAVIFTPVTLSDQPTVVWSTTAERSGMSSRGEPRPPGTSCWPRQVGWQRQPGRAACRTPGCCSRPLESARGTLGVDRGQEVLDRRVVHLPAGAEHALHLRVRRSCLRKVAKSTRRAPRCSRRRAAFLMELQVASVQSLLGASAL